MWNGIIIPMLTIKLLTRRCIFQLTKYEGVSGSIDPDDPLDKGPKLNVHNTFRRCERVGGRGGGVGGRAEFFIRLVLLNNYSLNAPNFRR